VTNINFLLFTTCESREDRLVELKRLLDSVDKNMHQNSVTSRHYILLQRANVIPESLVGYKNAHRIFICVNRQLSLSRARNVMLHRARENNDFAHAQICAFPDDDAWYPDRFLINILDLFSHNSNISIATCDYGSQPRSWGDIEPGKEFRQKYGCGEFTRRVSSNTLILRSELAAAVGYFDERLGIGAEINGGEDLDFALRSHIKSGPVVLISNEVLIGHRDRLPWVRSRYFSGSLFAIARSARQSPCVFIQLIRKLCVGVFLAITGDLQVKDLLGGTRIGITGFLEKDPKVDSLP